MCPIRLAVHNIHKCNSNVFTNSASTEDLMCKQYSLVVLTNAKHFWAWASAESGLSFIHSSKSPTASST